MFNLTVKWTALKNLLYMAFHIYKTNILASRLMVLGHFIAGQQTLKITTKLLQVCSLGTGTVMESSSRFKPVTE